MRSPEEIARQKKGLLLEKAALPEFSLFGDANWENIDAQISIITGESALEDYEDDVDFDDDDHMNSKEYALFSAAEDAYAWLDNQVDDDLFDSERLEQPGEAQDAQG